MESNRQKKLAQLIQEDFAELFRKQAAESSMQVLITVSDVRMTPDLGIAKVYLSIFPQSFRKQVMKEVTDAKSQYRNYLGQKVGKSLRTVPDVHFYLDESLDLAEKVEKELRGEGENPVL